MKSILRTSAFIFAVVMFASSVSGNMAFQNGLLSDTVNAQETANDLSIAEHIEFYNSNKSSFDIQSESIEKLYDIAKKDNRDNTYMTLNVIGKKAGVDVSSLKWSNSIAAQVFVTEILMNGDFINASSAAYQSAYKSIVENLLDAVRKTDSKADKNAIYEMSTDSFDKVIKASGLSKNNLSQIKSSFPATKDYYDNCVAFAAYKKSRTVITDTLLTAANYMDSEESAEYAKLLSAIAESFTGISFSDYQKIGVKPALNSEISSEVSEKIVTSCITQLIKGNCSLLSTLMLYVRLSLHKDIDFFSEILEKYDCQLKSRAEERELFKSAYLFYKGASASFTDSNGFPLKITSDTPSLDVFECGMALYKKSASLMLKHAEQYAVLKSINDKKPEIQSIQIAALCLENSMNKLVCHGIGKGLTEASSYNAFTVRGPVNISVYNGSEKVAEIVDRKVTINDKTNLINIETIQLSENEKNPARTLVVPAGYDIEITASGDGTMTLSNVKTESGEEDLCLLYKKVPVIKSDCFKKETETETGEVILKNISRNLRYYNRFGKELKGDVNEDDVVNAKDLVDLRRCILLKGEVDMSGSDINDDGETNSLDMVKLVNIFLEED